MKLIEIVALIVGGVGLFFAVAAIAACRLSSQISRKEEQGPRTLFAPDDLYSLSEEDRRVGLTKDPPIQGEEG